MAERRQLPHPDREAILGLGQKAGRDLLGPPVRVGRAPARQVALGPQGAEKSVLASVVLHGPLFRRAN